MQRFLSANPSAPRASVHKSSRVVTEALKATSPESAYPKTSLMDLGKVSQGRFQQNAVAIPVPDGRAAAASRRNKTRCRTTGTLVAEASVQSSLCSHVCCRLTSKPFLVSGGGCGLQKVSFCKATSPEGPLLQTSLMDLG